MDKPNSSQLIDLVLNNPSTSTWLKEALKSALDRDPVDAANDVSYLAWAIEARCQEAMEQEVKELIKQ